MVGYKIISLDESGKASFEHPSKLFVLSAVLVPESFRSKLDNKSIITVIPTKVGIYCHPRARGDLFV